nr:MAG TPA: Mannosyl-glycoprotein endo-beta-N-acetylglucosaminidase [Caudoviricetes sp.]
MKKYRKTGKGLLGILDRSKTGIITMTVATTMLASFSFASADALEDAKMQDKLVTERTVKAVEYIPYQPKNETKYTHSMDEMLYKQCKKYGVDDVLAIAIARLETGHYASDAFTILHNWGGMTSGNGYYIYDSEKAGAKAFVRMLKRYADNGMTTPEAMQKRYCPDNENWAKMVRQLMQEVQA